MRLVSLAVACFATLNSAASQSPQHVPALLDQKLALELVRQVRPDVERLRQLSFKKEVPVQVIDTATAREHWIRRLASFQQREQLEAVARAYKLLGLLPADMDVWEVVLEAVEQQAAGFYDPSTGSYYLLDDMPAAAASVLTAHELTHALEDQHFDLDGRLRGALGDDDRLFGLSAVHEGSATLLMLAYGFEAALDGKVQLDDLQALGASEASQAASLSGLPPVLSRQFLGPYVLGSNFLAQGNVMDVVRNYPVEAVNEAYRDGPRSSEQVLHPEKYWQELERDEPRTVDLGGVEEVLGSSWTRASQGVLGELTLGLLVGATTPAAGGAMGLAPPTGWTNDAASGWGGDSWELWRRGRSDVVLLLTVWDSAQDAREFARALPSGGRLRWQIAGDRVALVAGAARRKARLLLDRMLDPRKTPSD